MKTLTEATEQVTNFVRSWPTEAIEKTLHAARQGQMDQMDHRRCLVAAYIRFVVNNEPDLMSKVAYDQGVEYARVKFENQAANKALNDAEQAYMNLAVDHQLPISKEQPFIDQRLIDILESILAERHAKPQ